MHYASKYSINTNLKEILGEFNHYKSIYVTLDSKMQNRICLLPFFQCYITAEGQLSPCCALYNNEKISAGNVFEQGFEAVWNGKEMQKLRKQFAKKTHNFAVCKDCIPRSISVLFKMSRMLPKFIKS